MRRLLLLLVLAMALSAGVALRAQPAYWVALNFRVTFNADGTAVVDAKLHPFTVDGRSLLENKEVEASIRNQTMQTLSYILLMFSDNPRLLRFSVLTQMEKRYGEYVLCDVAGTGRMTQFQGAYVFSVKVYLNTSNYIRVLNDSVFEVKLRDSFTSTDPRSWIDVLEVRFNGTEPLGVSWEPLFAHGPAVRERDRLLWMNFNEQEAPDVYTFILRVPGLRYVGEPPEVTAVISGATLEDSVLRVKVSNTGSSSGYVYVYVRGGTEQARKIYLFSREEKEVVFPYVASREVTVELYSGSKLLDAKNVTAAETAQLPAFKRLNLYGAVVVVIAVFVASLFAFIILRKKELEKKNT
ncbi:hypothetical protein IG193_06655 [Infirmifilum lucidum]|uniref:Uncharacterized protein n=1 Tax=Infirmifilum lucidum TaxID=2776706 RepID=A0A7L9FF79_9CREN|nr:hypothetical protein [Infirmifilum lucidum]QOJ78430.1 hypothetical protein IG193_06655 [Infirmifilum lucidum]